MKSFGSILIGGEYDDQQMDSYGNSPKPTCRTFSGFAWLSGQEEGFYIQGME
jgi:hypothetical protein